ncbi:MAG: TonB family protein [Silvibacterium sp.]
MTTAAIRVDWVGRVIDGRFPLLKWLGGSEWSGVFLTELMGPGSRKMAIKLVPEDSGNAKARIAGWAAMSGLAHPHLMPLLHTGHCEVDGTKLLYSVTEYAEEVLSEIIAERALTPDEAKEMLVPVLDALFYLHGKGFVHGHLKPPNIMAVGNQLKISGDSLEVAGERGRYFPALSVYDAPELATGSISPAADVWSLGATLVEALTQHTPVWDRSTTILRAPVVPESVPQPFGDIVPECLRLDPARRCTLSDINKARFEPARPLPDAPAQSPPNLLSKSGGMGSTRLRVTALIAGVVVLLAVLAIVHWHPHRARAVSPTVKQQIAPDLKQQSARVVKHRHIPAPGVVATPAPARSSVTPSVSPPVAAAQASNDAAVKGAVAQRVLPDVPGSASRTIQGTVRVRVRVAVGPGGDVSNATFDSAGPSKYFAGLALRAAQGWKFTPAQVDGAAARSVWVLQFDFRQAGTEVTPVEVSP